MALTELEELLVDALKLFGLKARLVSAIMVFLRTEHQQWQLVDYLQPFLDRDESPTKEQIIAEVEKIVRAGNAIVYYSDKEEAFTAATHHDIDAIKEYVLSGGDINICNNEGHSLLTVFVRSYNVEFTAEEEAEFDKHSDDDNEFWYSYTPKYWFIPLEQRKSGIKEKLDFFFEHGADSNLCKMVDGMTETPLMWAVVNQDYYLTKYLLEHGADPAVHLFEKHIPESSDGKEYWLMDHLDIYIMDGDKGKRAQTDLAIAQLLWEHGLKNWGGYCIDIDPHKGVIGGHSLQVLF